MNDDQTDGFPADRYPGAGTNARRASAFPRRQSNHKTAGRCAGALLGGTSSLTAEPDRVRAANIRVEPLIQAEKGYFAETDYNTDDQAKLQADAKQSSNVPLTIGAAVEKGGSADQRVQVNSSRSGSS